MNCVRMTLTPGVTMTKTQIAAASGRHTRTVEGELQKCIASGAVVFAGRAAAIPGRAGQPEKLFALREGYVWPDAPKPRAKKPKPESGRDDVDVSAPRRKAPPGLLAVAIASRTDLERAWSMR